MAKRVKDGPGTKRRPSKTAGWAVAKSAPASAPADDGQSWSVEFLNEAVVKEINAWPVKVRAVLDRIVARIEAVGIDHMSEPHVKHLRGDIWEMRASADGNTGRALYVTVTGKRVVIVMAKMKKTQKTPPRWITVALDRAKEIETGAKS